MSQDERREIWAEYLAEETARGKEAARNFPYKLVETTGERALATWAELKAQQDGAPIVLGGPGDLYRIANRMAFMRERGDTPEAVLAGASKQRFPRDLLAERAKEYVQTEAFWRREREGGRALWFEPDEGWPPVGPWPEKAYEEEKLAVASEWDFERDAGASMPGRRVFLPLVYIAVLTGADATEAPARLLWGDWNDVPDSATLVAALRSWRTRYGAELVGISHDTWSLSVARPPQDRDEALGLAREMVAVCPDLLDETRTLQGQAALTLENDWWNFWWD